MPKFEAVSFDCYGTLIDWGEGMSSAVKKLLEKGKLELDADDLLARYGRIEQQLERGPYMTYRQVLTVGLGMAFQQRGASLSGGDSGIFADTLPAWPKFAETTEVLSQLKDKGLKLVILSNVDDNLIQGSLKLIGIDFDAVITAEQVRSYKPAPGHWNRMLEQLGVTKDKVLHVGASYHHDVQPGRRMAYTVAWINRTNEEPSGPERPDHQFPDLRGLLDVL